MHTLRRRSLPGSSHGCLLLQAAGLWGAFNLVSIEVEMYKRVLRKYPQARWLVVVSGDSIPTAAPSVYVDPPLGGRSCLGYTSEVDPNTPQFYSDPDRMFGTQWKFITRSDAQAVVKQFDTATVSKYQAEIRQLQQAPHPKDGKALCHRLGAPDEWVIPTILARAGRTDFKQHDGHTIMDQEFTADWARPCPKCEGLDAGHAQLFTHRTAQLSKLIKNACKDQLTMAFRKVGRSLDADYLLQLLQPAAC